jgi:hypothetical protein
MRQRSSAYEIRRDGRRVSSIRRRTGRQWRLPPKPEYRRPNGGSCMLDQVMDHERTAELCKSALGEAAEVYSREAKLTRRSATCVFASASLPDKKTTRFPPSSTGSVSSTAAGSFRPRLGFRYTPPTAVTPHGGFCGSESQQWLGYPTNLHAGFCLGRRVHEATLAR